MVYAVSGVVCARQPVSTGCKLLAGQLCCCCLSAACLHRSTSSTFYLYARQGAIAARTRDHAPHPLTSVSTHSPTPLASHHLLTVVISCIVLQAAGEHCGTGIILVGTLIYDRRAHVVVAVYLYAF